MTELLRKQIERLVIALPLPSQRNRLYFLIHCKLAGWAMFLGEPQGGSNYSGDLPF